MSVDESDRDSLQLPEDLPPVQPPSAGFIVQLFVVPGLIVLAIVAVWLLFGKMASSEQDWKRELVELQNPNQHRRWRAAQGLALMLKADQDLGARGEHLARNREMAQALSDMLTGELKQAGQGDEEVKHEAFVARTLGMFDLPDVVVPALEQAMRSGNDREVRKNAIVSIAVMADRFSNSHDKLDAPGLLPELLDLSRDDDSLIRQLAAYTLGFFPQDESKDRLVVLLDDGDSDTRIDAAIALARQGDARGSIVFKDVLSQAQHPPEAGADAIETFLALKNSIEAIQRTASELNAEDRRDLAALLEPIAASHSEPKIRIDAKAALHTLKAAH